MATAPRRLASIDDVQWDNSQLDAAAAAGRGEHFLLTWLSACEKAVTSLPQASLFRSDWRPQTRAVDGASPSGGGLYIADTPTYGRGERRRTLKVMAGKPWSQALPPERTGRRVGRTQQLGECRLVLERH